MSYMDTHTKWLQRLTNGDSGRAVAIKAGVSVATTNRQISRGEISAENVIAISRAYGQSPVEALAQTGYLTQDEATGIPRESLADLLTDQELIRALAERVDDTPGAWDETFSVVVEDAVSTNVSPIRPGTPGGTGADQSNEPVSTPSVRGDDDDGTVGAWDDEEPHAADSSPDEDRLREEEGADPHD